MLNLLNLLKPAQKNFTARSQITAADVPGIAAEGYTHILCARPDAELMAGKSGGQSGGQPEALSRAVGKAARKAGLEFCYMPVGGGQSTGKHVQDLAAILSDPQARVLGYCRSGMRAKGLRKEAVRLMERKAAA